MRNLALILLCMNCGRRVDLKQESVRYDAYLSALPDLRPVPVDKVVELAVLQVNSASLPGLDATEVTQLYSDVEKLA
ncbi:hypothetical protein ABK046_49470, partial [Streptomyces caeruleatus]